MPGFKFVEKLSCGPCPPFFHILQSLADAFLRIRARGNVEQLLVGFCVPNDSRCFAFYRQHQQHAYSS